MYLLLAFWLFFFVIVFCYFEPEGVTDYILVSHY